MLGMGMYLDDVIKNWYIIATEEGEEKKEEEAIKETKANSRILDHRKISKLKSNGSSDWLVILVGVFFVAGVAGIAIYQSFQTDDSNQLFSNVPVKFQHLSDLSSDSKIGDSTIQKLPSELQPNLYTLYLHPYLHNMTYTGLIKIRVRCTQTTKRIVLHSINHNVHKIAVKTVNVTDIEDILVNGYQYNKESELLVMHLNQILIQKYDYDIYIGFNGNLTANKANGIYVNSYDDGQEHNIPMIVANFKATLARKVFPCFDEPIYKAHFKLILGHNKSSKAYSNGVIEKITPIRKTNEIETHFLTTNLMSTYHVTFTIGKYELKNVASVNGVEIGVLHPMGRENETTYAAKILPAYIECFEKILASSLTIKKLSFSSVTGMTNDISETVGLVQVYEPNILYDKLKSSLTDEEDVAYAISRGIGTQWFGGLLTTKSWKDEWLMTSLAIYLQHDPVKSTNPSWDIDAMFYSDLVNQQLIYDSSSYALSISNKDGISMRNFNRNLKGAALFNMLNDYIGNAKFNQALQELVSKYQYKNLGYKGLLSTFTHVSPQIDIVDFMDKWVRVSGYPLITVKPNDDGNQLVVVQKRYKYNNISTNDNITSDWRVPMKFMFSCTNSSILNYMDSATERFDRKCRGENDWYKVNAGAKGFYRVNYDTKNSRNILRQLNTDFTIFSAADRANLLADVFELAYSNYKTLGEALQFTTYLKKERNYIPLSIGFHHLKYIANTFRGSKVEKCVKNHMSMIAQPILKYLDGLVTLGHNEKHIQHLLTSFEQSRSTSLALNMENKFLQWLISSERDDIPSHLRELYFVNGITHGNNDEYESMVKYYRKGISTAERTLVLKALASSTSGAILLRLVESLTSSTVIYPEDKLKTLTFMCNTHTGINYGWNFVLNHWKSLYEESEKESYVGMEKMISTCLSTSISKTVLTQVQDLMKKQNVGIFYNLFQEMLERIRLNIAFALRKHELEEWYQRNEIFDANCNIG